MFFRLSNWSRCFYGRGEKVTIMTQEKWKRIRTQRLLGIDYHEWIIIVIWLYIYPNPENALQLKAN